jgi:hypothetical protein
MYMTTAIATPCALMEPMYGAELLLARTRSSTWIGALLQAAASRYVLFAPQPSLLHRI